MAAKSKQPKEQAPGEAPAAPSHRLKASSFIATIPVTVQEILDEHIARKLA
jgi:hypothetical protein